MKIQNFMKNGPRIHEKLFWTQKAKKGLHFVQFSLKIEWKIFFGFKYLPYAEPILQSWPGWNAVSYRYAWFSTCLILRGLAVKLPCYLQVIIALPAPLSLLVLQAVDVPKGSIGNNTRKTYIVLPRLGNSSIVLRILVYIAIILVLLVVSYCEKYCQTYIATVVLFPTLPKGQLLRPLLNSMIW
jgi:hypothetical protein